MSSCKYLQSTRPAPKKKKIFKNVEKLSGEMGAVTE